MNRTKKKIKQSSIKNHMFENHLYHQDLSFHLSIDIIYICRIDLQHQDFSKPIVYCPRVDGMRIILHILYQSLLMSIFWKISYALANKIIINYFLTKKVLTQINIYAFQYQQLYVPYLHQFSTVMPFGTNLHYIWFIFSIIIKKLVPELHLLMVLFGTNLVSTILGANLISHFCWVIFVQIIVV